MKTMGAKTQIRESLTPELLARAEVPPSLQNSMRLDPILTLAHTANELHHQAAANCAPMVRDMIQSRTQDHQQIEHMLDRLLDCACIPDGLSLFRSLCRCYFPINPAATANYVNAYREMWDSEESGKELAS